MYVYKLDEDEMIILYKHENNQHSRAGLVHSQHKPGRLTTVQQEDLRNHVYPHTAPFPRVFDQKLLSCLSLLARSQKLGGCTDGNQLLDAVLQ